MRTNVDELPLLVGSSPLLVDLRQEVQRVAKSDAKVLITGESGVGKEVVARSVHTDGPRQHHDFIAVNCAGLPETLLESELFGHAKGSFTGAYRDKPGKLEMAHQGTVFLDEVGEMTLRMQGMLLRFLETGELQKVGSERASAPVNVRVIAATNRNLRHLIDQGQFREDLYLPAQRHSPADSAAARTAHRHPGSRRPFPRQVLAEAGHARRGLLARGDAGAASSTPGRATSASSRTSSSGCSSRRRPTW